MKLTQDGAANSTNYQAHGDINLHAGLGVADVVRVAELVVRSNMKDLANLGRETAEERIHDFAQKLSERLEERPAAQRAALVDPDVQYAISNAGIAYARRGTEEMSEILLDLVSDRISSPSESLLASVLNDAIEIAPRLIRAERAALGIMWTFLRSQLPHIMFLEDLKYDHQPILRELGPDLPKREGSYLHLQSVGCISINKKAGGSFASLWYKMYPGFFQAGVTLDLVAEDIKPYWDDQRVFEPSVHGKGLKQIAGGGASDEYLSTLALPEPHVEALKILRDRRLPDDKIIELVRCANPDVSYLESSWEYMRHTSLSAVGIAIAHAVHMERFGDAPDLATWVDEG